MFQRLRPASWVFDIGLAVFVLLSGVLFAGFAVDPWVDVVVAALTAAAVALRRASPPIALIAVSFAAVAQMALGVPPNPVNIGQLMVVYACAAFGSRRLRRISLFAAIGGAVVATIYIVLVVVTGGFSEPARTPLEIALGTLIIFVGTLSVLGASWLLGLARYLVLRARDAAVAQRIAEVEAERDRERATVERERARVAREMHDVLAHSLVSISMLSDGARAVLRVEPVDTAEVDDLVRTIGETSRDAVTDVRRLLAELRHEQESGPAASLDELPSLIGRVEGLGLDVDRIDRGTPVPLTPGASLAAYRVVQECLTNALRHGDTRAPVRLELDWRPGALHLTVRNRMRAGSDEGPSRPAGHGLVGIRERVLLEAGTIEFTRGADFVVHAALPTGSTDALETAPEAGGPEAAAHANLQEKPA